MSHIWKRHQPSRTVDFDTSRLFETVILAVALVVGLVVVLPVVALVIGLLGSPRPVLLLVGVAVVGLLYGLVLLIVDRVLLGTAVATVVTATFAADLPLTAGSDAYPGSLGPELWLVHLPLLALCGLLAIRGALALDSVSRAECALGAFVVWSVVVAITGPVPRPDVALSYSLFSLVTLLAFGTTARCVQGGIVSLRGVVAAFLVTVGGHVAFAIVQLANQGLLGLSVLGETARSTSHNVVALGPTGFNIGVFVSGLTGGNGSLALQIVLALPIALAVAASTRGRHRTAVLLSVVLSAAVLRFTAKDAARGAAIVAITLLAVFVLWEYRDRLRDPAGSLERPERWAPLLLSAVGALFVPSTIVGGSGGGSTASSLGNAAVVGGRTIHVPFFNLNTLGVRVQQYVLGIDIFASHPLTGVGGANFVYAALRYDVPEIHGHSLHNLYLSLLVGTGVPGFVLYVTAVTLVLWSGWRLLRSAAVDRLLVAGVLAALAGYLAASLLVLPIRATHALPFWILAGAVVAEDRRVLEATRGWR